MKVTIIQKTKSTTIKIIFLLYFFQDLVKDVNFIQIPSSKFYTQPLHHNRARKQRQRRLRKSEHSTIRNLEISEWYHQLIC